MTLRIEDCPPLPVSDGVQWRHVPDWPGYCVSDTGVVMSCWLPLGKGASAEWKPLRPRDNKGYPSVHLTRGRGGKRKRFLLHRLVLNAFVGPRPPGLVCRHFPDPSPMNNNLSNLQWGTIARNARDTVEMGRHKANLFVHSPCPTAKVTPADVVAIRERWRAGGATYAAIGAEFGIKSAQVRRIVLRKSWSKV